MVDTMYKCLVVTHVTCMIGACHFALKFTKPVKIIACNEPFYGQARYNQAERVGGARIRWSVVASRYTTTNYNPAATKFVKVGAHDGRVTRTTCWFTIVAIFLFSLLTHIQMCWNY